MYKFNTINLRVMERNNRPGVTGAPQTGRRYIGKKPCRVEMGFVKYHVHAEMINGHRQALCCRCPARTDHGGCGLYDGRGAVACRRAVGGLFARGCLYECVRVAAGTSCSSFARGFAAFAVRPVARYGGERVQLDGSGRRITRIYVPVDFRAYERGASPMQTFGAVGRAPQRHPARAPQALPG